MHSCSAEGESIEDLNKRFLKICKKIYAKKMLNRTILKQNVPKTFISEQFEWCVGTILKQNVPKKMLKYLRNNFKTKCSENIYFGTILKQNVPIIFSCGTIWMCLSVCAFTSKTAPKRVKNGQV